MLKGKQRAFLRGKANNMSPLLQVGKNGITESLINQLDEALKSRELVKGKVLNNSLYSAREAAEELARECNAHVIQTIGSIFVLYRANPEEPVYRLPE